MNTKLVLLLVLVSLPSLTFSAPSLGIIARTLKKLWSDLEKIDTFCSLFQNLDLFNCSLNALTSTNPDDTSVDISIDKYIATFQIGNPQQNVSLIVDINHNLTFMLCQPCQSDCSTESTSNIYDRTLSSSFSNYTNSGQPLSYKYTDSYVISEGFLVSDMVYYGSNSSVQYTFGCGVQNTGDYGSASGYLGLGPGDFSALSQLGIQNFSYCLGPELDGAIYFGYDTISSGNSTLLLRNSLVPQYYYVNLTGIKIGNQDLDIPSMSILPQLDGSGGMFITTTISRTYLEESAYKATKDELINQVNLSQTDGSAYNFDLCFDISGVDNPLDSIPQLTLHLNGADMVPPIDNYFVSDTNGTILCLAVLPSTDVSVLGTWMQTNFMMFYDLNAGALQFQSFNCSSLD